MTDKEKIKQFVQKTLGCRCPGEVFQSIDCRRHVPLSNDVVLHRAITIGNRLLIYVVEVGNRSSIEKHLALLVSAGKSERDSNGLNRFRLVIVTDESPGNGKAIRRTFEELREGDLKIHLHVISNNDKYLDF